MSKADKKIKKLNKLNAEIETPTTEVQSEGTKEPATKKHYLTAAAKLVRKMDKIVMDANDLTGEAADLVNSVITTEVTEKDVNRFDEMENILRSVSNVLFYVTERMARKYVDKNIAPLVPGRKSLKK